MDQEEARDYLRDLADALDRAERKGTGRDVPEGARWIGMSDTLARDIAVRLRNIERLLK
jgi:hypothetical protein